MSQYIHLCLDIRGAIHGTGWTFISSPNGRKVKKAQAVEWLMDRLAEGKRVLPIGECDGFSFQTGCPGHEEPEADDATTAAPAPIPPRSPAPYAESGGSGVTETTGDTARTAWGPAADDSKSPTAASCPELPSGLPPDAVPGGESTALFDLETAGQGAPLRKRGDGATPETTPAGPAASEANATDEVTHALASAVPRAAGPAHNRAPAARKRLDIRLVDRDGVETTLEVAGG